MAYHIKLGNKDDLREYSIANKGLGVHMESANPFSAKLNTDQQYGDLEGWNEWVVDDWTSGVGYKDPEDGYLYGKADTRFPNQAMLPFGLDYPDSDEQIFSGNDYAAGDHTVDGVTITKASQSFTAGTTGRQTNTVWIFIDIATAATVTVALMDDSATKPGSTTHTSGSAVVTKYRPGPIWLRVGFANPYTTTASTRYHLVVSADASFTLPKTTNTEYGNTYDGATWSGNSKGFQTLLSFIETDYVLGLEADSAGDILLLEADSAGDMILLVGATSSRIKFFAEASGILYSAYGFDVRYWNESLSAWTAVDTVGSEVTSMISTGTEIFWAYTTGMSKVTPATSKTAVTDYTNNSTLLTLFKGLLYKTEDNNLYYSSTGADGSWTGPFTVGPSTYAIRGLKGMGDNLFMSTDEALFALAPGDYVVGIVPWPTISSVNGRNMNVWMSDLYIPLVEDLIQYNEGGGLVQVGLKRAEGLPEDVQGVVYQLHPTQYFLLASVAPPESGGFGSVWAYNGEGWHGICLLPQDSYGGAMHVDTTNNEMWFGGDYGLTARLKYPSSVLNPAKGTSEKLFARVGWIEYDWFYGGPVELQKDIESIFLFSEDTDSTSFYKVYWQDDDSTDWELLGSFTADSQEVRWTAYTPGSVTRPATRRIKLGIYMRTDDEEATPLLRAQRMKFHTNVTDRWRWNLAIESHDDLEALGPGLGPQTQAQMQTHLIAMVQSVPPVIFEDYDGQQYEVKVKSASRRATKLELINDTKVIHYQWDVNIEQITEGVYSG